MSERLAVLEVQIPILEAKLTAMKRERKALKAREQMRRQRKDPAFNAKVKPPYTNAHFLIAYNESRRLPWPKLSKPHNRYLCLKRKGWTRDLAIEKISAEGRL